MALPKKISEEKTEFIPLFPSLKTKRVMDWSEHGSECPSPENTHRKRYHQSHATHRQTITATWSDGSRSRSYVDRVVCAHCGHSWDQEWMSA